MPSKKRLDKLSKDLYIADPLDIVGLQVTMLIVAAWIGDATREKIPYFRIG